MASLKQKQIAFSEDLLDILQVILISSVVLVNILISHFIRSQNILFQVNANPIGFWFAGYYSAITLVILISVLAYYLNTFSKSFVGISLIITGIYSNFFEKVLYTNVIDYLSISNLYYNLADLEIIIGLIFLNYKIFARKRTKHKKV